MSCLVVGQLLDAHASSRSHVTLQESGTVTRCGEEGVERFRGGFVFLHGFSSLMIGSVPKLILCSMVNCDKCAL